MFVVVRGARAYWRFSVARHPLPQQRDQPGQPVWACARAFLNGGVFMLPPTPSTMLWFFEKCKKQRRPGPPPKSQLITVCGHPLPFAGRVLRTTHLVQAAKEVGPGLHEWSFRGRRGRGCVNGGGRGEGGGAHAWGAFCHFFPSSSPGFLLTSTRGKAPLARVLPCAPRH